ncbi:MFS transporter [Streptomyces cylindrosporus]|uniref:MFS transporter n=1 Tax=Streptomyces cylindrosporus TaxID=2927583 RepID=A0ABS9Y8C1_9ACTN|nr:MFS transporter [Streptomyces cylindrosporus]MCI3273469.1 MFS transporter [Streptomyces cylindrosporus]
MDNSSVPVVVGAPGGSVADVPRALPPGFVTKIALAQFGLFSALLTPVLVTLPLRVAHVDPAHKTASLSLVLTLGALFSLIGTPLVGRLSDRTTSRFGRRRPWLVGGVAGGLLGLSLIAFVPSVPVIAVGWVIAQSSLFGTMAALQATVADQVPASRLGKVSGALGFALTVSTVAGAQLVARFSDVRVQFLGPALLAFVLVTYYAVTLPDQRLEAKPGRLSVREIAGSFWTNPVKHRDFGWAWLSRVLVMFGIVAPPSYLAYYLMSDFQVADAVVAGKVGLLILVNYVANALVAACSGWISDKAGARKPFVIGASLVIALSLVLLAYAPNFATVVVSQILAGAGAGMFYAVDMAMITVVLPSKENAAKDLGVMSIANALPLMLAPLLAPALLGIGGGDSYALFFTFAGALALAGALSVPRIRGTR